MELCWARAVVVVRLRGRNAIGQWLEVIELRVLAGLVDGPASDGREDVAFHGVFSPSLIIPLLKVPKCSIRELRRRQRGS